MKVAEFIASKEKVVNIGDPIIFENNTDSRWRLIMNKPKFIYTFKFENDLWRYCYYDVGAAKDKAIEVALSFNPGFEIEGFYFDNDGEDLHLFYDETEDDGEIVTIHSYKMEDSDI